MKEQKLRDHYRIFVGIDNATYEKGVVLDINVNSVWTKVKELCFGENARRFSIFICLRYS